MRYAITITGVSPIIQNNGAAGLDTRSPANLEKATIARKRGSNRTEADDERLRQLGCQTSLWLDDSGAATVPHGAIRAMIEASARKLKQGPQVREGLLVESVEFDYDRKKYGTDVETMGNTTQFVTGVVVQRSRILRTRARFDLPWAIRFTLDVDSELVDIEQLRTWLDIGGRRIGLGDWRPEKSGWHGRFTVESVEQLS